MSERFCAVVQALLLVASLTSSACSVAGPTSRAVAKDKPRSPSAASARPSGDAAVEPSCPPTATTVVEGKLAADELDELSGAIASQKNPGAFWVHNDSGDEARLFAIDIHGRTLAELTLTDVDVFDPEDIALARGRGTEPDALYLGDIGDNVTSRPSVQLYRVDEPELDLSREHVTYASRATRIDLRYDDGPHDAETLLIDPVLGDLYLVSKSHKYLSEELVGVYRVPAEELKRAQVVARRVAHIPLGPATAGDIAPDGSAVVVRNYWSALYWPRAPGESIAHALAQPSCRLPVSDIGRQGESLAFTSDGRGYVTIAEGLHAKILRHPFR